MENSIGNHIVFLLISGKPQNVYFFSLREWAEQVLVRTKAMAIPPPLLPEPQKFPRL